MTYRFLSDLAQKRKAYVVGGSIPEFADGKIYNTSYIFDRKGGLIGKHRKIHLFDIDVKGGQYFKESDVLSPGREITVFDTEFGRMGVCICFDIRFPDLFIRMREAGAKMVFIPAAFNMTTGPAHWETLFRSRALDQQVRGLLCRLWSQYFDRSLGERCVRAWTGGGNPLRTDRPRACGQCAAADSAGGEEPPLRALKKQPDSLNSEPAVFLLNQFTWSPCLKA